MQTPFEAFRSRLAIDIRFADIDSLGHVNNAKYLTFMEHARVRYFRELGLWDGTNAGLGLIQANANLVFKLPLHLGDSVEVLTRVSRLGSKSLDTEHLIVRGDGAVAATGAIVLVAYDYRANQSIVIPDGWRAALVAYEPGLA